MLYYFVISQELRQFLCSFDRAFRSNLCK